MSYIGRVEQKASDIRRFNVTGSTSATHTLTWTPPNEQSLIITINGVKQQEDAYSVSGTTLTLTSALVSTDKMEVIGIQDVGETVVPGTGTITDNEISSSANIAKSKLASLDIVNADVNASAAIALSKLASDPSNASNLASGTVPTARLGSGTASSSTFLRGDQSWASAGVSNEGVAVHLSADVSLTRNVRTKVEFDVEDYDPQGWFDSTTNYRFQPDVSGTYFIDACVLHGNGTGADNIAMYIYKNGSEVYSNQVYQVSGTIGAMHSSGIVSLNGSSDYVEIYTMGTSSAGGITLDANGWNATTTTECRMSAMRLV